MLKINIKQIRKIRLVSCGVSTYVDIGAWWLQYANYIKLIYTVFCHSMVLMVNSQHPPVLLH